MSIGKEGEIKLKREDGLTPRVSMCESNWENWIWDMGMQPIGLQRAGHD